MKTLGLVHFGAYEVPGFVERALDTILLTVGSRAGALFRRGQQDLAPFGVRGGLVLPLQAVERAWKSQSSSLEAGAILTGRCSKGWHVLVPVMVGQRLVGLVYLERNEAFESKDCGLLSEAARVALRCLESAVRDADPVDGYLASTSPDEILRDQLVGALERSEWNVSKAARMLRIARGTVYERMKRFGVPRRRVSRVGIGGFGRLLASDRT